MTLSFIIEGGFTDGLIKTRLWLLSKMQSIIIENAHLNLTVKFADTDINLNVHFHLKCMLLVHSHSNFLAI